MSDLRTQLIVNMTGNVEAKSRSFGRGLENMSRRGRIAVRALDRGLGAMGRGLDRLGNRYTAFILGAGGIGALRSVGNLESRFTRLGIQANKTAGEIDALKEKIFEISNLRDIRIDPGQLTAAIEEIVEKTGDLDFARDNLRNLAAAIQATGAEGIAIGGIAAEFQKMGIRDPGQVLKALDILDVQGKQGAFTLQNLAALGPRVVTAYTAMGRTGVPAIREMGAALQVIRQGTGSSEMAATAFEALMRTLADADKIKLLQRGGIKIFDPDALKKGQQVVRPINELMVEIIKRANGRQSVLSKIFDAEALRAFNAAASEFQRTGNIDSLDKFYNVQADGKTIMADSARAAKDFNASMQMLNTAFRKFADTQLSEPIKDLAGYLNSLEPGTVDRWMRIAKWVGLIGGGAVLGRKIYSGGRGILNMFRGGGAGGGAQIPGMGGIPSGVVPVYVVNSRMSLLNDGSGFGTSGGAGGKAGPAGAAGSALKKIGAASIALPAGYAIGTALQEVNGSVVGMLTKGKYSGPGWMGQAAYDLTHTQNGQWRVLALLERLLDKKNEPSELNIRIDGAQAKVTRLKAGSDMDVTVDTGRTMVGPR